jgi:hypothetical protein
MTKNLIFLNVVGGELKGNRMRKCIGSQISGGHDPPDIEDHEVFGFNFTVA